MGEIGCSGFYDLVKNAGQNIERTEIKTGIVIIIVETIHELSLR